MPSVACGARHARQGPQTMTAPPRTLSMGPLPPLRAAGVPPANSWTRSGQSASAARVQSDFLETARAGRTTRHVMRVLLDTGPHSRARPNARPARYRCTVGCWTLGAKFGNAHKNAMSLGVHFQCASQFQQSHCCGCFAVTNSSIVVMNLGLPSHMLDPGIS